MGSLGWPGTVFPGTVLEHISSCGALQGAWSYTVAFVLPPGGQPVVPGRDCRWQSCQNQSQRMWQSGIEVTNLIFKQTIQAKELFPSVSLNCDYMEMKKVKNIKDNLEETKKKVKKGKFTPHAPPGIMKYWNILFVRKCNIGTRVSKWIRLAWIVSSMVQWWFSNSKRKKTPFQ